MTKTHKPRVGNRLTDLILPKLKPGKAYADGLGLYLKVESDTSRHWFYRYKVNKAERFMGLGSYPAVTLADARQEADRWRRVKAAGKDPLTERDRERAEKAARAAHEQARRVTFKQHAEEYLREHEDDWRNPKHRAQWRSSLEQYVYPIIGDMVIGDITVDDVLRVLKAPAENGKSLWREKAETMSRVRGRIEEVLSSAKAAKLREGENPAAWKDNLKHLLGKRNREESIVHHRALHYAKVPEFMQKLRDREGVAARCLEFTILNASRTSETTGARWPEFDLERKVWIVPANRIKAKRAHTVLLTDRSIAILKEMQGLSADFVFPGRDDKAGLSNNAMLILIERMGYGEKTTTHGFRSAFKDWAREMTNFPDVASEISLAHRVGDQTFRAYARGELLAKRRMLMEAWANYCGKPATATVVPIGEGKRKKLGLKFGQ
jgi:integrase